MPTFKINEEQRREVLTLSRRASGIEDFVRILNFVKYAAGVALEEEKDFTILEIIYFLNNSYLNYKTISLPKKNGDFRTIHAPYSRLKIIQQILLEIISIILDSKVINNKSSHGFVRGSSIVSNAKPHVNKRFVLNYDIENFFPSINYFRIKGFFKGAFLAEFNSKELLAFIFAGLSTYRKKLPQGSPISPIISNLICQNLDKKLIKFSSDNSLKYTRYADDLTFSTNHSIDFDSITFKVANIVKSEGFRLNVDKSRIKDSNQRQTVTGIVVNTKLNINRKYIRRIRAILDTWDKYGEKVAHKKFNLHYKKEHIGNFKNVVHGYIDFVGQVRGKDDNLYIKLRYKYKLLLNSIPYTQILHDGVRKQLRKDNKSMESVLFDNRVDKRDMFKAFIAKAFLQIENLLKYYYYVKFTEIDDMKGYLIDKLSKNEKSKKYYTNRFKNRKRIKDFSVNDLLSAYENVFHYSRDDRKPYDKFYTILRECRNEASHRSSMEEDTEQEVVESYKKLELKLSKYYEKHGKWSELNSEERNIEFQYKRILFLRGADFDQVRSRLQTLYHDLLYDMDQRSALVYYANNPQVPK